MTIGLIAMGVALVVALAAVAALVVIFTDERSGNDHSDLRGRWNAGHGGGSGGGCGGS